MVYSSVQRRSTTESSTCDWCTISGASAPEIQYCLSSINIVLRCLFYLLQSSISPRRRYGHLLTTLTSQSYIFIEVGLDSDFHHDSQITLDTW